MKLGRKYVSTFVFCALTADGEVSLRKQKRKGNDGAVVHYLKTTFTRTAFATSYSDDWDRD